MQYFLIGFVLLLMTGCVQGHSLSELESKGNLDSLVGTTESEIIARFGKPKEENYLDNLIPRPPGWKASRYKNWKESTTHFSFVYDQYRINFNFFNEVISVEVEK